MMSLYFVLLFDYVNDFGILLIVFVFLLMLFSVFMEMNSKNNFFYKQTLLPTSKIRSMAMGHVEVKGKVFMQEPLLSEIGRKKCIGYIYVVEELIRGRRNEQYRLLSKELVCNDFIIKDDTGQVQVNATDIDLLKLDEDHESTYSNGYNRYKQYLLCNNMEVLLIGNATNKNQKVSIEKDPNEEVFALAPTAKVKFWDKYSSLRKSLVSFCVILIILIALVLLLDISYENNKVIISVFNKQK